MPATSVTLAGGASREQGYPRELPPLHPPTLEDELYFDALPAALPPAQRANALLARCMDVDGAHDIVRALPVGERDALLLQLRRITIGEQMEATLNCPAPDCQAALDLDLDVTDFLAAPEAGEDASNEYEIADAAHRYALTLRCACAGDQEDAARMAKLDPHAAADMLFERCVSNPTCDGAATALSSLPAAIRDRIEASLALLDPRAELELQVSCASCGERFTAVFDPATFVLAEFGRRARHAMHDIHVLALNYHWSERDIVALPAARRRMYLALIDAHRSAMP